MGLFGFVISRLIMNARIKLITIKDIVESYEKDRGVYLWEMRALANKHRCGKSWDGDVLVDKRLMSRDFNREYAYSHSERTADLWNVMDTIERHNVL